MILGKATTLLLLAGALVSGCDREPDAAPSASPRPPVEWSARRGPLEALVRAAPGEVSVGERITLTIDVYSEGAITVQMPEIESALGDFAVVQRLTPPDVPDGARRRWSHRYVLSTFRSGEVEIPPLAIQAREAPGQSGGEPPPPLESEALVVTVTSLLGPDASPTDFASIRGAVDVPVPGSRLWLAWIAAGIVLVLGALAFLRFRRAAAPAAAPAIVPHEWARRELEALVAADLVRRERFHEFFVRLSDIVRRYLELRFGLCAPERTTAEFIAEMRSHPALGPDHQRLLAGFLRAADLVKFALHSPPAREADDALAAASAFVEQTAVEQAPPVPVSSREAAA